MVIPIAIRLAVTCLFSGVVARVYPAIPDRGVSALARETKPDLVVAADGTGDDKTVQAAVNSVPAGNRKRFVILIKPGVYKERLVAPADRTFLVLRGEGAAKTVITFDLSARSLGPDGKPVGTSGSTSVLLGASDFEAGDITFENSAGPGTKVGQAVAVKALGDRMVFRRCRFLGCQDTLYANGAGHRQDYRDCTIAGTVDFIFGNAAAVFELCTITSRPAKVGAVTAQSRLDSTSLSGYILRDCDLTAEPGVPDGSVILGRPWRPYARVVSLSCRFGPQIKPTGWDNWRDPTREKTAFYAEDACSGPGADRSARVAWERVLTPSDLATFDPARFLSGGDGWNPLGAVSTPVVPGPKADSPRG